MKPRISTSSNIVLLCVGWLVLSAPCTYASPHPQAEVSKEPIQVLSDSFGGNGDPGNNPRVVVAVVPEAAFSHDELTKIAHHLLSQYDDRWLELWIYSDRDQLFDPVDVNLFRFFEDETLGAKSRRPWGLALRLDGNTELKFKDRATNTVVVVRLEPKHAAASHGAT